MTSQVFQDSLEFLPKRGCLCLGHVGKFITDNLANRVRYGHLFGDFARLGRPARQFRRLGVSAAAGEAFLVAGPRSHNHATQDYHLLTSYRLCSVQAIEFHMWLRQVVHSRLRLHSIAARRPIPSRARRHHAKVDGPALR